MTGGCQTVASWSSGLFKQARLHLSEGVLKIKDLFACYEGVPQGSILGPIHAFFNNQPDKKKCLVLALKSQCQSFSFKDPPISHTDRHPKSANPKVGFIDLTSYSFCLSLKLALKLKLGVSSTWNYLCELLVPNVHFK